MTYELVLTTGDVRNIHVVSRGGEILVLLAGEDVDGDKVDLGVTVLASLGGRHIDDLARAALDDDETVLAQSRALHGVGGRRTGISRVELKLMLCVVLAQGFVSNPDHRHRGVCSRWASILSQDHRSQTGTKPLGSFSPEQMMTVPSPSWCLLCVPS
jgi:hypothetical protein